MLRKFIPKRFFLNPQNLSCFSIFYHRQLSHANTSEQTHFGFQRVHEAEKQTKVDAVFENVADKYDVMNDAMSVGIHRLWKDYFMEKLAPPPGTKLLDVAGGTGDIAFRFLKYTTNESKIGNSTSQFDIHLPQDITRSMYGMESPSGSENDENDQRKPPEVKQSHVTVCDINQAMLDVGKSRAKKQNIKSGISWLRGNAECLPIADNCYDAYTIAYGIRNVTHIDKVLSEAYRVLKPGGRFMCLEFSQVPNPILRKVYDEYSFQVIPVLGQLIAADWHSYQYLVESIRQFPAQEEFADMIREAGFRLVSYENLTFGVTAMHSGFKL